MTAVQEWAFYKCAHDSAKGNAFCYYLMERWPLTFAEADASGGMWAFLIITTEDADADERSLEMELAA